MRGYKRELMYDTEDTELMRSSKVEPRNIPRLLHFVWSRPFTDRKEKVWLIGFIAICGVIFC